MRKNTKDIIDALLEKFGSCRSFETEHFIYWMKSDSYVYDGDNVTKQEFDCIKQYAAHNGTLPNVEREKRNMTESRRAYYLKDIEAGYKDNRHPEVDTKTYSRETILRYSKTYDSLEFYRFDIDVRAPIPKKTNRVLVMKKRNSIFTVTNKGYVRIYGNRWLSLKNWERFNNMYGHELGENVIKLLMKSMIGKDWVLNLEAESIWIHNQSARQANSFDEAISIQCGAKPAKFIRLMLNNDNDSIIKLYSLIEPNKIHYITNFLRNNKIRLQEILNKQFSNKGDLVLFLYFLSRDNRCEKVILDDYFRMLIDNGQKINLNISSYSTIKRNHDELSRRMLLKSSGKGGLGVKKIYPNIKSTPELGVEKIKTTSRLNLESTILHHCVHSYAHSVRAGNCAIYSLLYDNNSYTLELRANKISKKSEDEEDKYEFKINQLRGKYNSNPPMEMKSYIDRMCDENNILPVSDRNVYFKEEREHKKIIQIGEKILDRVDIYGNVSRLYEGENPTEIVYEANEQGEYPF